MAWDTYRRKPDRESIERLRRWPGLLNRFPKVRIYSRQWGAYWRGAGNGYTQIPEESKVWDCREAYSRVCHCGPETEIYLVAALQQQEGE